MLDRIDQRIFLRNFFKDYEKATEGGGNESERSKPKSP
jgi:hypothetical protein